MTPWHRAYFHITYIDKYIDAWIYSYKHTYCTYKHSEIHSFTLVHIIFYAYIFIHLIAYIHKLQLSFSSIFDCGSFFSELLFYFLLFPYSFFLTWLTAEIFYQISLEKFWKYLITVRMSISKRFDMFEIFNNADLCN